MSKSQSVIVALSALLVTAAGPVRAESSAIANRHFRQAMDYRFSGNSEAAAAEFRRGLEIEPGSVEGHGGLGTLLMEECGDLEGAVSELVTAMSLDPANNYYQRQLDKAMEFMNSTAAENIARGNDLYRQGQLNRAAACYRVAVLVAPDSPEAYNSLAWTLYRLGQLHEAVSDVRYALKLKPEDPEYINTLACILYDQGDLNKAIESWHKAINRSKTPNAADLYGLAVGLFSRGERQRALEYFKEAIKSDPHYKDVAYLRDRIGLSVHVLASHDQLLKLAEPIPQ